MINNGTYTNEEINEVMEEVANQTLTKMNQKGLIDLSNTDEFKELFHKPNGLYSGMNADGEEVLIHKEDSRLTLKTLQKNGYILASEYDTDGFKKEDYIDGKHNKNYNTGEMENNMYGLTNILVTQDNGVDVNEVIAKLELPEGVFESAESTGVEWDGENLFFDQDFENFLTYQGIVIIAITDDRITLKDKDYVISVAGKHTPNRFGISMCEFRMNFNKILTVIDNKDTSNINTGTFNSGEAPVIFDQISNYLQSEIAANGHVEAILKSESGTPFEFDKSESKVILTSDEDIKKMLDDIFHIDVTFGVTIENNKLRITATSHGLSFHCVDTIELDYKVTTA
ncbi:hypothetical protein QTG56_23965 (plasmid) [Rossellomorea sp. AcN35-11]|nr:hypothetical protein [Rossellomorea aquimaris]WJV31695.1 hypothetical protein QTG56_23965 [Rossellomorea sp. AcN35-11]